MSVGDRRAALAWAALLLAVLVTLWVAGADLSEPALPNS